MTRCAKIHASLGRFSRIVACFSTHDTTSNIVVTCFLDHQLSDHLGLHEKLFDRQWYIVATNALKGQGLNDGLRWLETQMEKKIHDK
jgi:hypothetical protein